jgi:GNAT superfamily N-acetyltransferase
MAVAYSPMVDVAELARLEHENMIAADIAAASGVPGARVERAGGLAVLATGLPLRLFNQVLIEDERADEAGLEWAVGILRERGAKYVVSLRGGLDDRFIPAVVSLGLVPLSETPWMPGMALHPLPPPAGQRTQGMDLDIRRVEDAAGIADHVRAAAAGFGMDESWLAPLISEDLMAETGVGVHVGYANGEAVTSGLGFRTGTTIGVYNIATVAAARRRGYGAAMTGRIIDDGRSAGCDVAILQASDMGYPTYERLGFRTVVEYYGWVDPASL